MCVKISCGVLQLLEHLKGGRPTVFHGTSTLHKPVPVAEAEARVPEEEEEARVPEEEEEEEPMPEEEEEEPVPVGSE